MRAVVCFGLFVLAVALIAEDASAISFDDLINQAEEARHPKPKVKKVAPREDPEMAEWSTEHLLGLDQPPPSHMFDSLFDASAAKHQVHHSRRGASHHTTPHKKIHKKKHVVHKRHSHKAHKKLHASTHHKVAKKVHASSHHRRESAHDFTENLLGSIPAAKHHHDKFVEEDKHGDGLMLNLDRHHGKTVQMLSTHIEDPDAEEPKQAADEDEDEEEPEDEDEAPEEEPKEHKSHKSHHKSHKKVHKKSHKKHEKKHESIMGSLKIPEDDDADAVVPEADAEEELLAPHLPRAHHHHRHAGPTSLSGLASSMLAQSESRDKAKKHAKQDAKKEQDEEEEKQEKREQKALGGKKPVKLDLGDDDGEDAEEEAERAEYDEDSLSSYLDDDDDDMMLVQLKQGDVEEW